MKIEQYVMVYGVSVGKTLLAFASTVKTVEPKRVYRGKCSRDSM